MGRYKVTKEDTIFNAARPRVLINLVLILPFLLASAEAKQRRAEITFHVSIKAPANTGEVRLWLPYPTSDKNQTIEGVKISGNYSYSGVYREKEFGNMALYSQWEKPREKATLTFSFRVIRQEIIKKDFLEKDAPIPNEIEVFLRPTTLGPIDGEVRKIAEQATNGKGTIPSRARALYDYLIDNFERDPMIVGCGLGDVHSLLKSKKGKCVDLHSVYVSLAKSVGVPAREILGIRIPKGKEGDMTGAYHCWAEFYLPGYGWVPIDPSDVRKIMLDKKIPNVEEAKEYKEYYFGTVDENRVQLSIWRDILVSPEPKAGRLSYFMYPYAEVDGKPLDPLAQTDLTYQVTYKEF